MKRQLVLAGIPFLLAACVSTNGVVKKPYDSRRAPVSLGKERLTPGDRVNLFLETCHDRPRLTRRYDFMSSTCTSELVGKGEIAHALADNEVLLLAEEGVSLKEGMKVEKN